LVTPVVFSSLTILLIYLFIGRALRPLEGLAKALEDIGGGRYRTRIGGRLAPELARLRDSFNRMAARLAAADAENRRLNEQLLTLQERERNELARDLHDEVSPFLFAINVDAASATRLLREGRPAEARKHVQSITDAVRPMQRQVRSMLGRLRPIGLEILRLLAEGRSLSQIADTVGIGHKTAANNCSRIKARLGAAGTADLIRIAIRAGLVDSGPLEPSSQNVG
jgi:two-component system, NarL family, sensor histidine kinase UhpB